jgi:hypothetical protein
MPMPEVRWAQPLVRGRAIGGVFNPNVVSIYDWNNDGQNLSFVEQRTRVNVKAQFTDSVSSFVELDSYDNWGEDFRSNYITGVDSRGLTNDDVEFFQAYVEADNMFGYPLRLRVGRQELAFGSQFLVGTRDFAFFFTGISFDAARLTYTYNDVLTIDAWASKLSESFRDFGKGDVDFYGVYASYTGIENTTLDAYWLLVRDDQPLAEDVTGGALTEWIEDLRGLDDYGQTRLNTLGVRAAGAYCGFDYYGELAYQFGPADVIGQTFKPYKYGDDSATFGTWGGALDVGYSWDVKFKPHTFIGFRYFGGEDNRDISFWDYINPFNTPKASVSFNRLFSNQIASGFMDLNNDLSNAWLLRAGVEGALTQKLGGRFCVTYYEAIDPFASPRYVRVGGQPVPVAPGLSWVTQNDSKYLGTEVYLFMEYHYSQDLTFEFGWSHLFTGEGSEEGNFVRWNGLLFNGGTDKNDADYVYVGSKLTF